MISQGQAKQEFLACSAKQANKQTMHYNVYLIQAKWWAFRQSFERCPIPSQIGRADPMACRARSRMPFPA